MINTMNRRTGQSSPLRATSTGWARSVAVSALASIALTAMFGAPAGLSSSIGVGAELLAALVVAGSAAALLWTSDATVAALGYRGFFARWGWTGRRLVRHAVRSRGHQRRSAAPRLAHPHRDDSMTRRTTLATVTALGV